MRGFTRSAARRRGLAQREQRRGAQFNTTSTFSYFTFQERAPRSVQGLTTYRSEEAIYDNFRLFLGSSGVSQNMGSAGMTD